MLDICRIPIRIGWVDVGRQYFIGSASVTKIVIEGLYKLSESSGFGGTMCAGISISGVGTRPQ